MGSQSHIQHSCHLVSHFFNNWEVITTGLDKWVLDCVKRFQILFTSLPDQEHWPNPPISSAEQRSLILAEVNMLLEKGAVTLVENPQVTRVFTQPCSLLSRREVR